MCWVERAQNAQGPGRSQTRFLAGRGPNNAERSVLPLTERLAPRRSVGLGKADAQKDCCSYRNQGYGKPRVHEPVDQPRNAESARETSSNIHLQELD